MGIHQPHRLFLITHPRTASNLLIRILALNDQPDVARHQPGAFGGGYFFGPASRLEVELGLREKHVEDWSEDHKKQIIERVQICFDNLENYTQSAETDGKIAFVKEHAVFLIEPTARRVYGRGSTQEHPWTVKVPSRYGPELTRSRLNETLFPDEYLRDWLPTFLIRHPALVFPSQYRAMKDIKLIDLEREHTFQCDVLMTFRYTRSLYDYWSVQFGKSGVDIEGDNIWPIVLEADDVMLKPEVVLKFTKLAGLDPTKLKFEWEPATNDLGQNNPPSDIGRRMLSTLNKSSGILLEKTSTNIDIGMEAKTWREEFGEKIGRHIEKLVRAAIPDYEYMKARSLRA